MHRSSEWRWHMVAGAVAAVLALGGARVADRLSPPAACQLEAGTPLSPVTGQLAGWVMLRQATFLRQVSGATPPMAPAIVPALQEVKVGQKASWEVAVLQLDQAPRTLEVDFGDGGGRTTRAIPPGSSVCVFSLARTYPGAAERRVLRFRLTDHLAVEQEGPSAEAFVDVVERP